MIKKFTAFVMILSCLTLSSCTQLLDAAGQVLGDGSGLTTQQIGMGLKQALELGITEGANKLSLKDGYFKSPYKVLLPEEAQKVTQRLSQIPGFQDVEQKLLEKINRGAEDAAKKAAPIFKSAITQMTFQDATQILMGNNNAATNYLQGATQTKLYNEFNPVIVNSLNKFGALDYWTEVVTNYNKIPLVKKINPRLDDHITTKALDGLFKMVEKKEMGIRTNINERKTDLLKKVFAKQDNK